MFPFRRGSGKKRPKGGPVPLNRRGKDHHPRRIPGSALELLNTMQPTTKALAQMLAGATRASGQLVHARNVLGQAERLVDERQIDRLVPADREEFLEQYARLKLTLADAEAMEERADAAPRAEPKPTVAVGPERLRELALRLASSTSTPAEPPPVEPPTAAELAEEAEEAAREAAEGAAREAADAADEAAASARRTGSAHRQPRLRLKRAGEVAAGEPAGESADLD
ncbi:MAG TPA: hypothetical protein VFG43_17390 [Geminicoccaceae bacterium]|nr:hypothetical protein [Geminicoccaceae bacterium]